MLRQAATETVAVIVGIITVAITAVGIAAEDTTVVADITVMSASVAMAVDIEEPAMVAVESINLMAAVACMFAIAAA